MSGANGIDAARDYDRRIGDWLEDDVQDVPGWLVDAALEQAHATAQRGPGIRLPWARGLHRPAVSPQVMTSLAAGALGALAVIAAFSFGLLPSRFAGDASPSPSPTASLTPPASPRPVGGLEAIDVLPQRAGFYTLIGLAATSNAVWTVAVVEDSEGPGVRSQLVRIDSGSGRAAIVPLGEAGMLSPPAAAETEIWVASAGALYRVSDGPEPSVQTVPLEFEPGEISLGGEGLWIAHEGGTSLVDPATGAVLRSVSASTGAGRIVGAPAYGSLWSCRDGTAIERLDPESGELLATVPMPAGTTCRGRVLPVSGVNNLADSLLISGANVRVDARTNEAARTLPTGEPWAGFVVVDGVPWFAQPVRGGEPTLRLAQFDQSAGAAARVLTLPGRFHLNTNFEGETLAVAGGYLWLLADDGSEASGFQPQLIRVPLSELQPAAN